MNHGLDKDMAGEVKTMQSEADKQFWGFAFLCKGTWR